MITRAKQNTIDFRRIRNAMFTRDIPPEVRAMSTQDLVSAIETEAFVDPFKYLELKNRGINP